MHSKLSELRHCSLAVVLSTVMALALSGCSGGGATTTAGDDQPPIGDDQTPGDDDQSLTIPEGLSASMQPPVYATTEDDVEFVWDATDNPVFPPLTAALRRDWSANSTTAESDAHISKIEFPDDVWLRVHYVVGGEERMVEFRASDIVDNYFEKTTGNGNAWIHSRHLDVDIADDGSPRYAYVDTGNFGVGDDDGQLRFMFSYGARTEAANLPAGTATYAGSMSANTFDQGNPSAELRHRMWGDLALTANFDDRSMEGMFSNLHIRRGGENEYLPLSGTTRFEIGNGHIDGGRFTASLTGVDTNGAAPLSDSVRGYQGNVLGEFYGPAAQQIGGVFDARRDEDLRIMNGNFDGEMQ